MNQLIELDKHWLIHLNGFHTKWLDQFMFYITQTWFWIPLYLYLLYLIISKYGKNSWIILVGIAITIILADQITSSLMKPYFERLRPTHEPSLAGLVHTVNGYKGGFYGFASSHAANTFGIALFVTAALRKWYRWISLMFVWAFLVAISRIYLGVHYPGDIIVGAIVGMLIGWLCFLLSNSLLKKITEAEILKKT